MKKRVSKFLSVLTILTLATTSVGFGDLENLNNIEKNENVINETILESRDNALNQNLSVTTTTGSESLLEVRTLENLETPKIDEAMFLFDKENGEITGYKDEYPPENLIIPETIDGVKVKGIGYKAFYYSSYSTKIKTKIKSIEFPDMLEYIGGYAFQGNLLETVTLPDSVIRVEERAFWGNQISDLKLSSSLKSIGADAFQQNMLTTLQFPNSVEEIGDSAFKDNKLKSVTLSGGLKKIGAQAFSMNQIDSIELPNSINDLPGRSNRAFWKSNFTEDKIQKFTRIYSENNYVTVENTQGILNPASITVKYKNEAGEELIESKEIVGIELKTVEDKKLKDGNNSYLYNYNTPSNNYKDYSFIKDLAANYFVIGQEKEIIPEEIGGYNTPDKVKLTLEKENEITFVYKSAGSKKLTLSGDGLKSDKTGDIGMGSNVKVIILPPVGKVIDIFKVNGQDKKSEIQYSQLEYSYNFKLMEDTNIEVSYKQDTTTYDKELKLEIDKSKFTLGEKAKLSVSYRGQSVDILASGIEFSTSPENILKVDSNTGEVRAIKSGTVILTGMLKGRPDTAQEIEITVEPFVSYVRIEGNEKNIAPTIKSEVTDLDLSKYNINKSFVEPKPLHVILKALENSNIDATDKTSGADFGSGSYISMIAGLKQGYVSPNDGWMYYVDNTYANSGIADYSIKNNQSIVVFFQEDYTKTLYSWFETEELNCKTSEKVVLKLTGSKYDDNKKKTVVEPIENAKILVNGVPYIQDSKYVVTDKNGQVELNFDKIGTYDISAEKKDSTNTRIISRPYCKVIVAQGEVLGADKSKLNKLIKEIEAILLNSKFGDKPGAYPVKSKEKLESGLKEAKVKLDNKELSQNEVDKAVLDLELALLEFKDSINKDSELEPIIQKIKTYYESKSKYDYITALGLRKAGMDMDVISANANIYGMDNIHNNARNAMNLIAGGKNPKDYRGKDYTALLANSDYSDVKSAQHIAKAIIAMDMSNTAYDEENAIGILLSKSKAQGDGGLAFGTKTEDYYDEYTGETTEGEFVPNVEDSAWSLIALSNHRDISGVEVAIDGAKKYLKSMQKSDGLIENSSDTALVLQALVALDENPRSDYWNSDSGKSLLDGILSCQKGDVFTLNPKSSLSSDISTSQILAALTDLNDMKSMYKYIKNEEIGNPIRIAITAIEDMYIGAKVDIEVKAYDKNNQVIKNAAVKLESLDSSILNIENKKATALKSGKVGIKASILGTDISEEITVNVIIPPEVYKSKEIEAEIAFLKAHYEAYGSFEFLASPASVLAGIDKTKIESNIYFYSNTTVMQNAKSIISVAGAGLNPRDIEIKNKKVNLVEVLENSQVKDGEDKGKFILNKGMDADSILAQSYAIIALDLVGASYDKESAINSLLEMLKKPDYKDESSYKNIKTEAVAATALSKHKEIKGVNEAIDKLLDFIKANQNEDGGFDIKEGSSFINSPIAIGAVIQALYSNDIDPFSWQWRKGENTMIDALVRSKFISEDASKSGYCQGEGLNFENTKSSHYAFSAVISMKYKKSIYELIKDMDSQDSSYENQLEDTLEYLKMETETSSIGSEWAILALSRGGYNLDNSDVESYISSVEQNLNSLNKATDYARITIALTSLGNDVEKLYDTNVLEKLSDFEFVKRQGVNASIFGLIATNTKGYEIPKVEGIVNQNSRANMLKYILDSELKSGGWALRGDVADPDTTAMAIQALAPYYKQGDKKVKAAVDRALTLLSKMQTQDGDYLSEGNSNPESTVQVLVALCELEKDPMDGKNGFVKGRKTLIDGILKYKVDGGGFKHSASEESLNGIATVQCAYGLVAYDRFVNSKTSLYDMSDVKLSQHDKEVIKLKLANGKVKVPLDNNKNFEVELNSAQKAQIVIPENTKSKIVLKTEAKKPLSEIRVQKGNHELRIPEGTKIENGHAEIELFIEKTNSQKAVITQELSNVLKNKDQKIKSVIVEDAFKVGNTDKIEFDGYVELVFPNMAGKGAAYIDNTGMHIIERVADDKSGNGTEYAFDRENDLVVKTNHFTDFITYTIEKETSDQSGNSGTSGGNSGGGTLPSKDITVTLSIDKQTIGKGYVLEPTVIKINKGDTVWSVLQKEMDNRGISYRYNNNNQYGGVYVESIDGDGEFDNGQNSGWMYNVNGKYMNYGCDKYTLNGGESIQWRYTKNLGEDLGQDNSSFKSGESKETETAEKGSTIVKADAKVDKKEAKAEIEDKRIQGAVKEAVEKKLTQIIIEPTVEDKKAEFNKVTSVLEKTSIEKIAKEAKASLKLKTKFGDVKLSQKTLENLLSEKGNTVTIAVAQNENNTVSVELKTGLDILIKISGDMTITLPVNEVSASTVMVKIMPDKTDQILMSSIAGDKVISAKLDGSSTVKIVQRKVDFADTSSHWAKENIEFVSARNIIKGTKKDEFSPNSRVNRAMLTTILHRFENEVKVEGENYSDVAKDAYYANAALWAKINGIISNTDKFDAKEELTREQIAEMIYNYAKASGEDVSNISKENVKKFEDFAKVEKASQEAVAYCYESGIIGGKSETTLDPKGKTTRAEVSAIIQRYINVTI